MTAIRETILSTLDLRLSQIAGVAEYERNPSGDPTAFPALSMTDNGQTVVDGEGSITRYALDLAFEGYVEGNDGATVSAELNELYASLLAAVMQEPPIAGLAESFEEGALTISTAFLCEAPRKGFRQDFKITFTTRRGNPAIQ